MDLKQKMKILQRKTKGMEAEEIIRTASDAFPSRIAFASSLGEEDQVITDMMCRVVPHAEIFTLDTGRLFPETYDLIAETMRRYPGITIKVYFPEAEKVEAMVEQKGVNLFYESVENRKFCCRIRKVEPLRRALSGKEAWICGLRRGQSATRSKVDVVEWDESHGKIKINPLAQWTLDDVRAYIRDRDVPVNALHQKGFVSIGCSPCTRAVKPGEDIRGGRWWWERPEQKECGLHNRKRGSGDEK